MQERSIASRIRNKARKGARNKARSWVLVFAAAVCAAAAVPAQAQDAQAGARKSMPCQTCHGKDGLGVLPDAPHLAGQPAVYLERALRQYRSGERKNEMMNLMAKPLTDDDIRDLAAFYAAIKIEIKAQ